MRWEYELGLALTHILNFFAPNPLIIVFLPLLAPLPLPPLLLNTPPTKSRDYSWGFFLHLVKALPRKVVSSPNRKTFAYQSLSKSNLIDIDNCLQAKGRVSEYKSLPYLVNMPVLLL